MSVALHPLFRELYVPALRGERREGEPEGVGPVFLHHDEGVYYIAFGLGHLLAGRIPDQGMDVDIPERYVLHELKPHHYHPGDPEKDNVKTGHEDRCGVILPEFRGPLRPAEGR